MKNYIILVIAFMSLITVNAQWKPIKSYEDNQYYSVSLTLDGGVLLDEGNINAKLDVSTHFNGSEHIRVNFMLETLTGHDGYYGVELGVGYAIRYSIGRVNFESEPALHIGAIVRPNQPMRVFHYEDGSPSEYDLKGFVGFSHSLNLKHKIFLTDRLYVLYHMRAILRSDLHYANELTRTPEDLSFYNHDHAFGLGFKF